MADFTTTQSGDWADAATWGGSGVPGSADTATVSHDVTISTTVTVGAITLREVLTVTGSLTLAANMVCNLAGWRLEVSGTLDLAGFSITPSAAGEYRFQGTSGSRAAVTSSAGAGVFGAPGTNAVTANFTYCDFDNVSGALGRTQTTAITQICTHCTFANCGAIDLDFTGVNDNCGFVFEYNKVTDWASSTPVASNSYIPGIYQTKAIGTAPRRVRFNVFDNSMNANVGLVRLRALGADVSENIFIETKIENPGGEAPLINRNFFSMENDQDVFKITQRFVCFCGNYVYFPQDGHVLTPNTGFPTNISSNIFDVSGGTADVNSILYVGQSVAIKVSNNIQLGFANLFAYTQNPTGGSLQIRKNTTALNNAGVLGSGQFFAPWLLAEQTATSIGSAAIEVWDNLHLDTDDSDTTDAVIDLKGSTADQLDLVDYNCGWGIPGGAPSPALSYVNVTITGGVGANDFAANPQFVDRTRNLAAWDTALGGGGTAANAIAELKKRNDSDWDSRYDVNNLLRFVAEGFQIQNASLSAGRHGGTVGAGAIKKTVSVPLVSWLSARA